MTAEPPKIPDAFRRVLPWSRQIADETDIGGPQDAEYYRDIYLRGRFRDAEGFSATLQELIGGEASSVRLTNTGVALGVIPGDRAVTVDATGKVYLASPRPRSFRGIAGISLHSAAMGESLTYVISGIVMAGYGFKTGPVWLEQAGRLTQEPSRKYWLYIVGIALAPGVLLVRPDPSPAWQGE